LKCALEEIHGKKEKDRWRMCVCERECVCVREKECMCVSERERELRGKTQDIVFRNTWRVSVRALVRE